MLSEIERSFDERRESEERLRRFIADASHELRTPLTSIRGYAELWRQGGLRDDADLAEAMRRTEQEGARMGVLVDDMLLLARLDAGRPLALAPVDLATLAADAVADARAVEPDRPIDLDSPGPLIVRGDEGRLRQVLANVLTNARDHTAPATPVRVRLGVRDDYAFVEVEDDGPGLGAEPQRVFERFYRADPARSRAHGGSGLGLSIVASVVDAHGGRVVAESSPSGGARVRVELPYSKQTTPAQVLA
jgi:two-component system OmpR family sensor kinase